jgi:hypothetical protein
MASASSTGGGSGGGGGGGDSSGTGGGDDRSAAAAAADSERQLEFVVDDWRRRNQDAEPSVEERQNLKRTLDDLATMHSTQNGGALPDDATVRQWFGITATSSLMHRSSVLSQSKPSERGVSPAPALAPAPAETAEAAVAAADFEPAAGENSSRDSKSSLQRRISQAQGAREQASRLFAAAEKNYLESQRASRVTRARWQGNSRHSRVTRARMEKMAQERMEKIEQERWATNRWDAYGPTLGAILAAIFGPR